MADPWQDEGSGGENDSDDKESLANGTEDGFDDPVESDEDEDDDAFGDDDDSD